jgi:IS30 family transposase
MQLDSRKHVSGKPGAIQKSLTWDRGMELAQHKLFTIDTNIKVYFCDPKSPWQKGTNENTNKLLRQYMPKKTDLSAYSQEQLDMMTEELNDRPRKILNFLSPAQKISAVLQ